MVIKKHPGVATVALAAVAMVPVTEGRQAAVVALMAGMVRVPAATGQGLAEPGREPQRESSEKPPVIYMPAVVAAVVGTAMPLAPVVRVAAVMAGHKNREAAWLVRPALIISAVVAVVDTHHRIATEGAGL